MHSAGETWRQHSNSDLLTSRSINPVIASLLLLVQKKLLSTSEEASEVEEGREEQKGKAAPLLGAFASFQRAFRKETEPTTMSVGQAAS